MGILKDYSRVTSDPDLSSIQQKADKLRGKHIVCINSTYQGGGVAEILDSIIILLNELGLEVGWRILHGSPDFFTVTKKFHNALQGEKINFSAQKKDVYYDANKRFSLFTHLEDHDLVMVHDPQPLPLIDFYDKRQPWIFRCHIDLTAPNPDVWSYLKQFIVKYDHFIVSLEQYKHDLPIPQSVVYPAIDPLSPKNKQASEGDIDKYLQKYDIDKNRPIITQVSRFDKWKDPLGVLDVFQMVRSKIDCQLVLLGSLATDDPEGQKIFERVEEKAKKSLYENDIKLILAENDFLVNCLQRASSVVLQKSLREGFGLTVSEALYKGTPVVASNVGGIPKQVIDGYSGFLHDPKDYDGISKNTIRIIKDPALREQLGKNGKEHVKKNFLITRLIDDWLTLFEGMLCK
ncbi:MAG: glycosyltransferase [Candidatus Bathyarchaeia archaeon]|jgi:trehalose synthase